MSISFEDEKGADRSPGLVLARGHWVLTALRIVLWRNVGTVGSDRMTGRRRSKLKPSLPSHGCHYLAVREVSPLVLGTELCTVDSRRKLKEAVPTPIKSSINSFAAGGSQRSNSLSEKLLAILGRAETR